MNAEVHRFQNQNTTLLQRFHNVILLAGQPTIHIYRQAFFFGRQCDSNPRGRGM